eukprot:jgi/Botrbrau1/12924/Bobra.92_1s0004.1
MIVSIPYCTGQIWGLVLAWGLFHSARQALGLASQVAEINSAVILGGPGDYQYFGGSYGSRCTQMVDRAAMVRQSRIMFVPTLYWVDDDFVYRKSVNSQGRVTHYCYERGPLTSIPTTCAPPTQDQYQKFAGSMTECFQRAISYGMDIVLAPHLDDGYGLGGWRNGLIFDPLAKYGDYSYLDFMLNPLADALNAVMTPHTRVWIAMQGEMSATVFYFPNSYRALLSTLRQRILANKPPSWSSNVYLGVSTNFDKLCGCVLQDLVDPNHYLELFPSAFQAVSNQFDIPSITALYNEVDFIGISNYASLTPNFPLKDLESATYQFAQEVKYFGVDLVDLIENKGKKLYWMEYGVGGGISQDGNVKARTAAEAAATPFFGIFGPYNPARDPFFGDNNPVRGYRNYLFGQTMNYLSSRGACEGCRYHVDGIFLWNDASWDIQGIYPETTTPAGSYRDPFLVDLISRFNSEVLAGGAITPINLAALPLANTQGAQDMPAGTSSADAASAVIRSTAALRNGSTDYGVWKKSSPPGAPPAGPQPPGGPPVPTALDDKNTPRYRSVPRPPHGGQVFDSHFIPPFHSSLHSPGALPLPFPPLPSFCTGESLRQDCVLSQCQCPWL